MAFSKSRIAWVGAAAALCAAIFLKYPFLSRNKSHSTTPSAVITFLKFNHPEFNAIANSPEKPPPCDLSYHEFHSAPDGAQLVLGKLDCEGSSRSLLLRSTNNGQNWTELAPSFIGSQIFYLQFVDKKIGFAVASHTREGPGEDFLLKTSNGGDNWESVSTIPKGDSPWLAALTSFEATPALITATFLQPAENATEALMMVESKDDGATWSLPKIQENSSKPLSVSTPTRAATVNFDRLPKQVDFDTVSLVK